MPTPTNDILEFCPDDTGTNLLSQADYTVASDRDAGNQPGIASSQLVNKALRQSAFIASQVAQMICDRTGASVLDDANTATLLANMKAAIQTPIAWQNQITNLALTFSVASSAATIAVKTQAAADPSATDVVFVGMRSATINSGTFLTRSLQAAASIVIPSTATLGQTSGDPSNIYVYLIDNAGTLELAVSHTVFSENALVSTTAISSSATSASVMYSTSSRTNVPVRLVGYILNTQTTAGTWATTASQIQLLPSQVKKAPTIQKFTSGSGTYVPPPDAIYLKIKMVGGGGGGGGSNTTVTTAGGTGSTGGTTTFGTSLLTCTGGTGGATATTYAGSNGGTATIGSGASGIALVGSFGYPMGGYTNAIATAAFSSGTGASSPFGGGGFAQMGNISAGVAGLANTGSGGSGAGVSQVTYQNPGAGGGAGGYIEAIVNPVSSSYAYAVGTGGAGGTAGSSGAVGGAGAAGQIIVEEHYQ